MVITVLIFLEKLILIIWYKMFLWRRLTIELGGAPGAIDSHFHKQSW